jgi:hypothetical protein
VWETSSSWAEYEKPAVGFAKSTSRV